MSARGHLIGIAGSSGSGKTALASQLALLLPGTVPVVALDAYYLDQSDIPPADRARINFDAPAALDHALMTAQLRTLAQGHSIDLPIYDFATHTRAPGAVHVDPAAYVIVEGLFALYWPDVRDLLGTKVYLDLPMEACLARREARDVRERGRTPESVRDQFRRTAWPMFLEHVAPTRAYADLVLDTTRPPEELAERVMSHLTQAAGISIDEILA